MKQGKKWMLVALALLALVTVALPLVGCKNAADGTGDTHTHSYGEWVGDANTYKVTVKCTVCGHSQEIPDFVYVKGGTVDGTKMQDGVFKGRKVTLSNFFIGKYEVTQAEYEKYCNYTGGDNKEPSEKYGNGDNYPAYYVSWYDAVVYCNKRSMAEGLTPCYKKDGKTNPAEWGEVPTSDNAEWDKITCDLDAGGYRLPTEAEWEYAARGGKPSTEDGAPWNYQWAGTDDKDSLKDYAWCKDTPDVGEKTHEVGKKTANSLGIRDMSGNVWEWCWDWHNDDPTVGDGEDSPVTNPTGPTPDSGRVYRGGSWISSAYDCSVSNRGSNNPYGRSNYRGFRVVRGL